MIHTDLPFLKVYPHPEQVIQSFYQHLEIKSILDIGTGHGGVYNKAYFDALNMDRRVAADIFWIRDCGPKWDCQTGIDAQELVKHYGENSFDWVQCIETLEHVANPELALEQMIKVCRLGCMMTSHDETQHWGPEQEALEKYNVNQAYRRQPDYKYMQKLGFKVFTEASEHRQLIGFYFKK